MADSLRFGTWRRIALRAPGLLCLLALLPGLFACSRLPPSRPSTALAESAPIVGDGYLHRVAAQGGVRGAARVHVYLEGDGRPFATRHQPARDPTPRRRLALDLMALDGTPAIYLGRPCYEGQATAPGCTAAMWTGARYGEAVVRSLDAALTRLRQAYGFGAVTLIGYSGGGTLAMLLASRLPYVTRVVTVAANLDIDEWTALHRYSPLSDSLNPAHRPALRSSIVQWHYTGAVDSMVPPALVHAALRPQTQANCRVLADVGHVDGWTRHWPVLLADFADGRTGEQRRVAAGGARACR